MATTLAKKTGRSKMNDRVMLNVGGWRYETRLSTLERYPFTRLGQLSYTQHLDQTWDRQRQEYFFDRNGAAFSSILHMYRTGEFHPDLNICGNVMKLELEYWGLSESDIESCCWGNYSKFKDLQETLSTLDHNFTSLDYPTLVDERNRWRIFKRNAWRFLEDPSSSRGAKVFAIAGMFFVLLSIVTFCLETHSSFRVVDKDTVLNETTSLSSQIGQNGANCCCVTTRVSNYVKKSHPMEVLQYIDYVCAAYFTLEYFIRLFFAPKKFKFIRQPLNVIDFVCLIPYYISLTMELINVTSTATDLFRILLSLRTVRVLRIFKLMKHYTAFKVLVYTIKVSTKELFLIVVFLLTGVLIFASVIYYVENPPFTSIPLGFWWALVTMTTVGYGDHVPMSEGGYIVGSVCVLSGVITIAFTVPIVVNNFTLYYSHAQSRLHMPAEKRSEVKRRMLKKSQRGTRFGSIKVSPVERRDKASEYIDLPSVSPTPDIDLGSPDVIKTCLQEPVNVQSTETLTIREKKSRTIETTRTVHSPGFSKVKNSQNNVSSVHQRTVKT